MNMNHRDIPIYVGRCCREWVLAALRRGRCGLCGETPTFVRTTTWDADEREAC